MQRFCLLRHWVCMALNCPPHYLVLTHFLSKQTLSTQLRVLELVLGFRAMVSMTDYGKCGGAHLYSALLFSWLKLIHAHWETAKQYWKQLQRWSSLILPPEGTQWAAWKIFFQEFNLQIHTYRHTFIYIYIYIYIILKWEQDYSA